MEVKKNRLRTDIDCLMLFYPSMPPAKIERVGPSAFKGCLSAGIVSYTVF